MQFYITGPLLGGWDFEEFNRDEEGGGGGDGGRMAAVAVRDAGGADELRLAADLHPLHAFGPAGDHAVEGELSGLVALVGAIELGAVGEGAAVVDLDLVGGLGIRPGPGPQLLLAEACVAFHR